MKGIPKQKLKGWGLGYGKFLQTIQGAKYIVPLQIVQGHPRQKFYKSSAAPELTEMEISHQKTGPENKS